MRSALRLIWALDVRHLVAHRARLALSAVGISAGVALAVAVSSLGSSIDASLEAIAEAAATRANVEVRPNARGRLPAEVLRDVRGVRGVQRAGATVESYTRLRSGEGAERVLVLGFDQGVLELQPEAVDPGTFEAADPFGLMLPRALAEDLGLEAGDVVEVAAPDGWREITVGALLPPGTADRGRIAVAAIGVVQDLLDRGNTVDTIYVEADDPQTVIPRIQDAVGELGQAGPTAFRQDQIGRLLEGATTTFNTAAVVALFVGGFLVYNTMAMAAVERVQEAALLRAVGARRRQVFTLFLAEGGVLGLVGSGLGLLGGTFLARVLLVQRGGPLSDVFPVDITRVSFDPLQLTAAGVAGVVASVVAAYLPARRVARADPARALGPTGALEDPTARPRRAFEVAGVLLVVAGIPITAVGFVQDRNSAALGGLVVFLAGVALLIRTIVPIVARIATAPARDRRAPTPGLVRLAIGEILRSPGRTAFTVGAVVLALSLVVGFAIFQASFAQTFRLRFGEILRADLYVRAATWRPLGSDVPLDASLADELSEVPGVAVAYPFRATTTTVEDPATGVDEAAIVLAFDFSAFTELPDLPPDVREENTRWARLLAPENRVLVSSSVPPQLGYEVGGTIPVPTPTGIHDLEIIDTFDDPSAFIPELYLDYADYAELWGAPVADAFPIGLEPGADRAIVEGEIRERFGDRYGVEVDTREEYQDRVNSLIEGTLGLISSVQLVALVVAALGLANTLLISTLERRRDLGVLRAVGMRRRQVRRMVLTEALLVGGFGVILAWGLGTVIGVGMRGLVQAQIGLPVTLVLPLWGFAAAGLLGLGSAALAAVYPAHRASAVDVVEALHYE